MPRVNPKRSFLEKFLSGGVEGAGQTLLLQALFGDEGSDVGSPDDGFDAPRTSSARDILTRAGGSIGRNAQPAPGGPLRGPGEDGLSGLGASDLGSASGLSGFPGGTGDGLEDLSIEELLEMLQQGGGSRGIQQLIQRLGGMT